MALSSVDLLIVGLYLAMVVGLGALVARRAGGSESGFFLASRRLPWWLAGGSLIATSFSIDTPLGIAGLVEEDGIAGVWFAWCFVIGGVGMLGYALFAELWRRSEVLTDAELVELRYGGRSAAGLRLFKSLYFGIFLNALTLAWVLKAVTTLGAELFGGSQLTILAAVVVLTVVYAAVAGFWGVVASDLPQYLVVLAAMVYLCTKSLTAVGGVAGLERGLAERLGPGAAQSMFEFVPTPGSPAFATFLAYVLLLWWAHKNANAAGPIVQRLLACRDEREARRTTLFFSFGHFAFNYWPMILLALCALALYPELGASDGVSRLFADQLPTGARGLVVAALLAAFMSTMDSHLNLGAAYLVHDVVRRFLRPQASERELVRWGRLSTIVVLGLALAISLQLESVAAAWTLLAAMTSGYGLVTVLRWFWWRINAWSEIAALGASFAATWVVRYLLPEASFGVELLAVVAVSTPIWLVATFLTAPEPPELLERFVARVRPWGAWRGQGPGFTGIGLRLGVWLSGTATIFGLNFTLGSILLSRRELLWMLLPATALAALLFLRLDRR